MEEGLKGPFWGGLQYIVSSDDCSKEKVSESDRFKYFDDPNIMEFIFLSDMLIDYPVIDHVPSDIGVDELFLPPGSFEMQNSLDDISEWTKENLLALNEIKASS